MNPVAANRRSTPTPVGKPPVQVDRISRTGVLLTAVILATLGPTGHRLSAQEGFRSVDPDRPIFVEDAYALALREWEFELGARAELGDRSGAGALAELKAGLFRNVQIGIELEAGLERPDGETITGIEGVGGHVLVNLRRETRTAPALGVRIDGLAPGAGDLGREDWGIGLKALATRTVGRSRLHANAGVVVASDTDGGSMMRLGVAWDRAMGLSSRSLLADLYAEIPTEGGRSRLWAEGGLRVQLDNRRVLDLGIATRLDEWEAGEANVELVIGLSTAFGIPAFTRVPVYPDPAIP
ncbi:MAG: hypothetical protein MJB57_02655 [Gemmatimonadetes bacterium]|nr:hypothetical protein [Gemmatimonadota bacterium]